MQISKKKKKVMGFEANDPNYNLCCALELAKEPGGGDAPRFHSPTAKWCSVLS